MKNLLILTPFLLFLTSCSQNTEAIQSCFAKILTQEEWSKENAKELLTLNSLKYLKDVAAISDSTDYRVAQALGFEYARELVTMKMHGEMSSFKQVFTSPGESLTIDNVLLMMRYSGTGVIGINAHNRLTFKEVANTSGNKAEVKVAVSTGAKNTNIISTYVFKQEEEKWKLDLLSTLSLEEKLLKQTLRRSPLRNDKAAFIANHLSSPPSEMQFQYRVK